MTSEVNSKKGRFLEEADRIGNQFLQEALNFNSGFAWETSYLDKKKQIKQTVSESIYSGTGGITLFLIQLYNQTREAKYLDAIIKSARWLYGNAMTFPSSNYAFFSGRMGVSFVLSEIAHLTKEKKILTQAEDVAMNHERWFAEASVPSEFINGNAGLILALMHLHAATLNDFWLDKIKSHTERLFNSTIVANQGVYWDKSNQCIRGLCGFSHGTSGIGFTLMELGNYFNNKNFYWLADQAFQYENSWFDPVIANWPDFRTNFELSNADKYKNALLEGKTAAFFTHRDFTAWCHGAPGIGMARLRANEILGVEVYAEDVERSLAKTKSSLFSKNTSFTICHGLCGNATLFLEAFRTTEDKKYFDEAYDVATCALDSYQQNRGYLSGYQIGKQEDSSLFMGTAGIGYYYLQVLDPLTVPNILLPRLKTEKKMDGCFAISHEDMLEKLRRKLLPASSQKTVVRGALRNFKHGPLRKFFIDITKDEVDRSRNPSLKKDFSADVSKLKMSDPISFVYAYVKGLIDKDRNKKSIDRLKDQNYDQTLELNGAEMKFLKAPLTQPVKYCLIRPIWSGVEEFQFTEFTFTILQAFKKEISIKEALDKLFQTIDVGRNQRIELTKIIVDQIIELLNSQILISKAPHEN